MPAIAILVADDNVQNLLTIVMMLSKNVDLEKAQLQAIKYQEEGKKKSALRVPLMDLDKNDDMYGAMIDDIKKRDSTSTTIYFLCVSQGVLAYDLLKKDLDLAQQGEERKIKWLISDINMNLRNEDRAYDGDVLIERLRTLEKEKGLSKDNTAIVFIQSSEYDETSTNDFKKQTSKPGEREIILKFNHDFQAGLPKAVSASHFTEALRKLGVPLKDGLTSTFSPSLITPDFAKKLKIEPRQSDVDSLHVQMAKMRQQFRSENMIDDETKESYVTEMGLFSSGKRKAATPPPSPLPLPQSPQTNQEGEELPNPFTPNKKT